MDSAEMNSDDDDVIQSPKSPGDGSGKPGMSFTSSLKRGLKLKDQSDTVSLSGALKRGFRKHALKSTDSMQNLSEPASPRNTKMFNIMSPKKSKRNSSNDDTVSVTSSKPSKSETRSFRGSLLRLDDVVPNSNQSDDTVSLIEGFLLDTAPIRHQEGIRDTIGRKNVVTLKKMVKLERPQGDKVDAKVLVLTPYRCQILGVKSPFKLEADFHFLDIKAIDSPSPQRLVVSTNNGKIFFMQMIGSDDADHIIGRVALSLRTIFPGVALSRILKASLEPLGRQKTIQTMLNQADQNDPGPCGNFAEMYRCICDYLGSPVREDVEWDVDTIYLSQNCHEINMKDFDLPETKDIIPIIAVMIYNHWFEGLVIRNAKLNSEVVEFILKVARNSHNLKELSLEGVSVKGEFAQRLSNSLIENKESCLRVLDLSNNPLEDKGLLHLSGALPLLKHGHLERLDVSKTGLTSKGINGLCQSLRSSPGIMSSLTHLNLSFNNIKSDEAEGLYNFLANSNHLTDLDISSTDCSVEVYVSALAKGCTEHLQNVKLGRNHFYGKKSKDSTLPPSFQEFFEKTTALKEIDFSNMKFPSEVLRCVMEGLQNNLTPGLEVSLNLGSCELKSQGCLVIQSNIASLKNLVKLDITDNSLDSDIVGLLAWTQKNKSLRELKIGRNFFGIKTKHMRTVMEAIVEMIQEEDSCLDTLSIADSKMREFLPTLLGCIGSNTSLKSLDISGNFMGDAGSRVLAKALQINSKLKVLHLDRNNLSAIGFHEIANAMEKNYSLRFMPYPVNDAISAMKHNPERTQSALARIQDLLLRNANNNKGSNDQQFRLQKVVSNTAQQVLDKVAEKVDDAINALELLDGDSAESAAIVDAKNLVKDAKNSKQLLSDIYGLGMERTSGEDSQLQRKIKDMAAAMDDMVAQQLKETVGSMLTSAEAQCPHIFQDIEEDLKSSVEERCLPADCIRDHVVKSSGAEIVNKVCELNLAVSTLISDEVTDSLLAALSQTNVSLTEELNKHKHQQKVGASEVDASNHAQIEEEAQDAKRDESPSRPATIRVTDEGGKEKKPGDFLPNMRKERAQSVAKRRQRPVTSSPVYEESSNKSPRLGDPKNTRVMSEFVKISHFGGEAEEEPLVKQEKAENESTEDTKKEVQSSETDGSRNDDSMDSIDAAVGAGDFPEDTEHVKLEHVTKGRPRGPQRRPRKRASKHNSAVPKEQDVDTFFSNNVSNTDFTETPTIEEEEEISRKERLQEKKIAKKLPGMGMPMVPPGMLRKIKKEEEEAEKEEDEEVKEAKKPEERTSIRRPKGSMVMPGMGFGGNLLAEMKLKKLGKKPESDDTTPTESEKSPIASSKQKSSKHETANENNNNNNSVETSPAKSPFLSMLKPKPDKGKPMLPPNKPLKGKPPPLPNKPKPALHRHGNDGKARPVSEFLEPVNATGTSLVRTRAASWGKKGKKDDA